MLDRLPQQPVESGEVSPDGGVGPLVRYALLTEGGMPVNPALFTNMADVVARAYGLTMDDPEQMQALEGILRRLAWGGGEAQQEPTASLAIRPAPRLSLAAPSARRPASTADETRVFVELLSAALDRARTTEEENHALTRQLAEYTYAATHDSVTSALNHTGIQQVAQGWIDEGSETKRRGVVEVDGARFKEINDTLAHWVGNEVLRESVQELEDHKRESDDVYIGRVGGDEFAVLFDDISPAGLASFVRRVHAAQMAKVANAGAIRRWRTVAKLQRRGDPQYDIKEREIWDGYKPVVRKHLHVNGVEVCQLRDLGILSVGGACGAVATEGALRLLDKRAETQVNAHKSELLRRMGGTYRVRPSIGRLSLLKAVAYDKIDALRGRGYTPYGY